MRSLLTDIRTEVPSRTFWTHLGSESFEQCMECVCVAGLRELQVQASEVAMQRDVSLGSEAKLA